MIDRKDHALLMNESYRHWTDHYLVEQRDPGEVLADLRRIPFSIMPICVLYHYSAMSIWRFCSYLAVKLSRLRQQLDAMS